MAFFMLQERGILKEANLDKKIPSPSKETTAKGGKRSILGDNPNGKLQLKLSATTPHRNPGPKLQKPIDQENGLGHGEKAAQKLDDNFKRTPQMMQLKAVRPRG